jgi:hypothetical protein
MSVRPHRRPAPRHRGRGRLVRGTTSLAATTAAGLVIASLAGSGSPASADVVAATPAQLTAAMSTSSVTVTGTDYTVNVASASNGVGTTPLAGFPTDGSTFAILTNGLAASADDANVNEDDQPNVFDDVSTNLGGAATRGGALDTTVLRVGVDVPAGANCLSVDFRFLSEEYPEFLTGMFNDAFLAELDPVAPTSTWRINGSSISAPKNFAFGPDHAPISINAAGNTSMSHEAAAGTTYDGATPLLSASTPITPGAHNVVFSIFDVADHDVDSAVLLDNLRVGTVSDVGKECATGATPKSYRLSLAPAGAVVETGQPHTVTANLVDAASGAGVAGAPVLFAVAGANPTTGQGATNSGGAASFTYTGAQDGDDTVTACHDNNGNGSCDAGEATATATVTWTVPAPINSAPEVDAGRAYDGVEGSPFTLQGSALDVDGDPLTSTWTVTPGTGVDAAATCTIADAHALTTTVTCDDDGTFTATLTADDGALSDDAVAQVTVANADPRLSGVTTVGSPTQVNRPVTASATFTDAGANDTHDATIDWGDGTSSAGTVMAGLATGKHTYADAGFYTPCVVVRDDDGAEARSCASADVIVSDPDAGFATAGGQFGLPGGDGSRSARGVLALVMGYFPGSSDVRGVTLLKVPGFCLGAAQADWLVVTDDQAVYSGSAAVNGHTGYRYLVSLLDGGRGGKPDLVRVRVWSPDTGAVLLDTQPGAAFTAAPTTPLQGSVTVH